MEKRVSGGLARQESESPSLKKSRSGLRAVEVKLLRRPCRLSELAAGPISLNQGLMPRTGVSTESSSSRPPSQTPSAQEACLRQFVADLAKVGPQRLVIEQDESLLKHDQTALYAAVRRAGVAGSVAYEHLPARGEPLLWIARPGGVVLDARAELASPGSADRGHRADVVNSAKPGAPTVRKTANTYDLPPSMPYPSLFVVLPGRAWWRVLLGTFGPARAVQCGAG